jgi:serine phosphatase RsbU (regulator of sigma subunit)
MMSDGLPERLNEADEMLDYPRTAALFAEAADKTPTEICAQLAKGGDKWANGRPQDDDVTFVVLKVNV